MGEENAFSPGSRTFCQIVGRDISPPICIETQGQEGCFGCAAPTRLCETCKRRPVEVSAVGMCGVCLTARLKMEENAGRPHFTPLDKANCQIHKRLIAPAMCHASQGQAGCRNCGEKTRLCESCRNRPVRFRQYGLCLACSVQEYGGGWKPPTDPVASEPAATPVEQPATAPPAPSPSPVLTLVKPKQPARRLEDMVFIAITNDRDYQALRDQMEEPVAHAMDAVASVTEAMAMNPTEPPDSVPSEVGETSTEPRALKVTPKLLEPTDLQKAINRAKTLIEREGRASNSFFMKKLGVSFYVAQQILQALEEEGMVGPARGMQPREILGIEVRAEPGPAVKPGGRSKQGYTLAEKVALIEEIIALLGPGSKPAQVGREVIKDLQDYDRVQSVLRRIRT